MSYSFEKIGKVIQSSKLANHLMYKLTISWDGIFGSILAKVCKPLKIKEKILFIIVKNHSWVQELVFSKSLILNNMKKHKIILKDIKFLVEEKNNLEFDEDKKKNKITLDKNLLCFIKDTAHPIKNLELKASFKNMLKAYIENNNKL